MSWRCLFHLWEGCAWGTTKKISKIEKHSFGFKIYKTKSVKWEIIKYSQTEKSLEKSVDNGFTAWYNNKAVGREYETKGNQTVH